MKKINFKIKFVCLSAVFIVSCSLETKNTTDWIKISKEKKTVDNISYYFPSEVDISRRNLAIEECQKAITENLNMINDKKN